MPLYFTRLAKIDELPIIDLGARAAMLPRFPTLVAKLLCLTSFGIYHAFIKERRRSMLRRGAIAPGGDDRRYSDISLISRSRSHRAESSADDASFMRLSIFATAIGAERGAFSRMAIIVAAARCLLAQMRYFATIAMRRLMGNIIATSARESSDTHQRQLPARSSTSLTSSSAQDDYSPRLHGRMGGRECGCHWRRTPPALTAPPLSFSQCLMPFLRQAPVTRFLTSSMLLCLTHLLTTAAADAAITSRRAAALG